MSEQNWPQSSQAERVVTTEKVAAAREKLKAEGKRESIRMIREELGGGSLSTIQPILKRLRSETPEVPLDLQGEMKPLVAAGMDLVNGAVKAATAGMKALNEQLNMDLDCFKEEVTLLEAAKAEALEKLGKLREDNMQLSAANTQLKGFLADAQASLEQTKADLIRANIREEDLQAAKKEAIEARNAAARLEGRLEEIEQRHLAADFEPERKGVPNKKK